MATMPMVIRCVTSWAAVRHRRHASPPSCQHGAALPWIRSPLVSRRPVRVVAGLIIEEELRCRHRH